MGANFLKKVAKKLVLDVDFVKFVLDGAEVVSYSPKIKAIVVQQDGNRNIYEIGFDAELRVFGLLD